MARNMRLNNAGNMKAPDEATGRKWWGKYGFTGLDEDGFAMFDTAAGGRAALEQQIRIDQGRDQTQEEFINKYVGASADPQGTTNAQINIPQLTGAPSDTTLSEIDKDVLFNAIVQNEGGKDSVKYFKPKLDYDALDRSVGAQGTAKEAASFLPTAPAPTIASETTGAAKPTATGLTGDQLTQRILDQDAALAKEEAITPMPAPAAGGNMTTPVGPVGAPAAQAMPTTGTAPTSQAGAGEPGLLDKWKSVLSGESEFSLGGLSDEERAAFAKLSPSERMTKEPRDDLKGKRLFNLQPSVTSTPGRDPDLPDEFGTEKTQAGGVPLASEAEIAEQYGEILRPQNKFTPQDTAQPELPDDVDAMGMDLEGMAPPEKRGLLSRLGGFAQNNPELLAQIAQAGGGFMQNIAQGRAQKKADAKTRGAMAQSNLIGALTGGKSRPAVMREEAEQGGLLARLGQAVQAGGSVAGGEMKRRTALSQRDEEMGLERDKVENAAQRLQVDLSQAEAQKAHQNRMLELQKLGINNDLLIARAKAGKKDKPPQEVYNAYLAANSVMSTVNTVEELMKDAGLLQAGTGLMAVRWLGLEQGLPQSLGGDKTREITAAVNRMVQTLGEDMSGILSNQDIVFLKQQAPSDEDTMSSVIKKADLIRKRIAESIRDRAGVDAGYFDMTPFGGLIDSVAAQGEQAPGDLAETLGQTEIKLP